jgi:hypothetical protein
MPNLPSPTDTDPLPPPGTTLYFRRCDDLDAAVRLEAALRGLPPDPLAAPRGTGRRS